MALNNKSLIKKIVERVFQKCVSYFMMPMHILEMWEKVNGGKGHTWFIICKVISEILFFS